MAKGQQRHQARLDALAGLGRGLARRARSHCELCETGGVPLAPLEVPPLPEEPEEESAILVCQGCREGLEAARGWQDDLQAWRFLEGTMWSQVPAVQVSACRLLRRLADGGAGWATDALDGLVLGPEVEEWLRRT